MFSIIVTQQFTSVPNGKPEVCLPVTDLSTTAQKYKNDCMKALNMKQAAPVRKDDEGCGGDVKERGKHMIQENQMHTAFH
ncbi:hypothetical protein HDU92_004918 [Lobulomyces angularis]|nr:hypothetical protein HDU92_004918 [Lobulomyces angularis]